MDAMRRAEAADADLVVEIITGSFHDDPTWGWAFPDAAKRPEQYRRFWGLAVGGALPHGWVWLSDGGEAAAVWLPPGVAELSDADEQLVEPMLREMLGSRAEATLDCLERFSAARPAEPHYYLSLLGTDPSQRGHGFGMRLMDDCLALIDEAGIAAYLESTNPVNIARYEKRGFAVTGDFGMPNGPTVNTMWRAPRSD
jgi:ribosomal protein S18 acetylase RimI-like enzyme